MGNKLDKSKHQDGLMPNKYKVRELCFRDVSFAIRYVLGRYHLHCFGFQQTFVNLTSPLFHVDT